MTAATPGQADGRVPFHWQGTWEEFDAEVRRRWIESSERLGLDHGMPNAAAAQQPQAQQEGAPTPEQVLAAVAIVLFESDEPVELRAERAVEILERNGVNYRGELALAAQDARPAPGDVLAALQDDLQMLRDDLADAEDQLARWPKCPAGCSCRIGTDDADANECGCDGPCTTGWEQPKAAPELAAADHIIRDILESLCRRDGLPLESTVVPGEPARNYALAERLGIGHVFGLEDVKPQPAPELAAVTKGDVIRIIPEKGPERVMLVAHVEHHVITLADVPENAGLPS